MISGDLQASLWAGARRTKASLLNGILFVLMERATLIQTILT